MGKPRTWALLLLAAALLVAGGCGGGGDNDDHGELVDDDTATDDDVDVPGDDDVAPTYDPECGEVILTDVMMSQDLDCSQYDGDHALFFGAAGLEVNCNGHKITASLLSRDVIASENRDGITVKNCELVGAGTGVNLWYGRDVTVKDNVIHGCEDFGIMLYDIADFTVAGNYIYDDAEYQAGMELLLTDNGEIADNTVEGARLGGIQFYGSIDCQLHDNLVHDIGDTCYGYFYDADTGAITSEIYSYDNEAYNCGNLGANEIMHGSHHLYFYDNYFHDSQNGFIVYDGATFTMSDFFIEDNEIANNTTGVNLMNDLAGVEILGNAFTGNEQAVTIGAVAEVTIAENTFAAGDTPLGINAVTLVLGGSEQIDFNHNVVLDYEVFLGASNFAQVDLTENYWNGCPNLDAFDVDVADVLDLINPINSLECFYVNIPINIVDGDGDGYDDQNCERAEDIECIEP